MESAVKSISQEREKAMESCSSCYWYADWEGVCCCADSPHRASALEENGKDPHEYHCQAYKEGEFWS